MLLIFFLKKHHSIYIRVCALSPFSPLQLTTLGYVAIYFSILAYRYSVGIVTKTMLQIPKNKFAAIGALEAISLILGMIAGSKVPGPLIPILTQTFLVWQVAMSVLILQKSFSFTQYAGAGMCKGCGQVLALLTYTHTYIMGLVGLCTGLVAIGAAVSTANAGSLTSLDQPLMSLIWPSLLFLLSVGPPALASVIKESIFSDGRKLIPPDPRTGKGFGLFLFSIRVVYSPPLFRTDSAFYFPIFFFAAACRWT